MEAYDAGMDSVKDEEKEKAEADRISKEQRHARMIRIFNAVSILIAAIACIVLVINSFRSVEGNKATLKKVDDLGEPVITNSRGQILNIPDLHIKYYSNDYMGEDTASVNNKDTQNIKK